MADNLIGAAPAGQPVTVSGGDSPSGQSPAEQAQPQVNYVTSEQLNAAMDEMRRMVQSSTDKSYNRVQKMIASMQQAGIQNPTEAQARAMLAMQDQSEPGQTEPAAQPAKATTGNPDADAWIQSNGGDVTKDYWLDIYDAAQEAGVGIITRDDPEYAKYFEEDGKLKNFSKPRHFVKAFEQAFAEKKERLSRQGNLASSPALGAGGQKSSFIAFKDTNPNQLITMGLKQ